MKKVIAGILLAFSLSVSAQVPLVTVVEHFTNSRCGVCASVNPGAYTTMNSYPNTKHISFHPSSPYSNCFFSMQNPTEQDGRAQWYGVYGSTPRFVVNGVQSSSAQLGNALMQSQSLLSSFEMSTIINDLGNNQREVIVKVKKVATSSESNASLFVSLFEDTVFQATPNGESIHQDVFRKALTSVSGNAITLPSMIGDSVEFNFTATILSGWSISRIKVLSLVQSSQKQLLQANESDYFEISNSLSEEHNLNRTIQNPVIDFIKLSEDRIKQSWEIFDLSGRKVKEGNGVDVISVSGLENGLYLINFKETNSSFKIIVKH